MGDKSKIAWCDATWNPVTGCTKISDGCRNCYAERVATRLQAMGQRNYANGFRVTCHPHMLDQPKRWKRPRKIFVCSMSDLFHDDVSDYFITRVFEVMLSESTQQHTFLVLTKRPIRMRAWFNSLPNVPHNVWAGVTVENQAAADERIPILTELAAPVRFLSCEPLVGPVWLPTDGGPYPIDWVIVAGESGPKARPMQKQWVMDLWNRTKYGLQVPFFFKQWGEFDENGGRVGKKAAGDLIDGVRYQEFPEV